MTTTDIIRQSNLIALTGGIGSGKSVVQRILTALGYPVYDCDSRARALMATPAITTIDQPAFQIGFQSCELLMEKIENPAIEEKHILLETELVVRESTALPVHI